MTLSPQVQELALLDIQRNVAFKYQECTTEVTPPNWMEMRAMLEFNRIESRLLDVWRTAKADCQADFNHLPERQQLEAVQAAKIQATITVFRQAMDLGIRCDTARKMMLEITE